MSQHIIMAIALSLAYKSMDLWFCNITQVYIQSTTVLQHIILAHLPIQIAYLYSKGIIIIVIKLLYSIAKSGTY